MTDTPTPPTGANAHRYLVVRVTEADWRTLTYAPDGERQITVTYEQEVKVLDTNDLTDLGLWDEAQASLLGAIMRPERCGAEMVGGGKTCLRAVGHPSHDISATHSHSYSARWQGL